jgi:hypothetical protein
VPIKPLDGDTENIYITVEIEAENEIRLKNALVSL